LTQAGLNYAYENRETIAKGAKSTYQWAQRNPEKAKRIAGAVSNALSE